MDGGAVASNKVAFQTSALPPGVPRFTIADGGHASPGYTLVSNLELVSVDPAGEVGAVARTLQYLAVVDGSGQPVWYLTLPLGEPATGDFKKQPNGTYTVGVYDRTQTPIVGLASNSTIYEQFDSLGDLIHTWQSPLGPLADPQVDGGFVNIIAGDQHELLLVDDGGAALLLGITPIYPFNTNTLVDGGGCWPDGGPLTPGGPRCNATDFSYELEKVAIDGGVLWDWNAELHIPPTDIDPFVLGSSPYAPGSRTIDGYHTNSIDVMTDGTYLLSFRDMSQIVDIDPVTGDVISDPGRSRRPVHLPQRPRAASTRTLVPTRRPAAAYDRRRAVHLHDG